MDLRPSREVAPEARRPKPMPWMRSTWPLTWSDLGLFLLAFCIVSGTFIGLGFLVTGPLDGSLGELDRDVAESLAGSRTDGWNTLSFWGSMLSETAVKICLTAVVVLVMLRRWKSWREPLLVATALVFEASAFLLVTLVVGRHRPDVPQLDSSPVDSSFPSGHTAAAVVYGAMAIVVFQRSRRLWPKILAVAVIVAVTAAVGLSRMYRGMHFLSDVAAGVLLGLVSLAITYVIVERAHRRHLDHSLGREFGWPSS